MPKTIKICALLFLFGIAVAVANGVRGGRGGNNGYNPNQNFGDFTPKQKADKLKNEQKKAKEAGKKCAKEGGNNAAKMACMLREGKKSIASAGGRNLTDVEVLEKIKEGAMQQAAEAVKNCTRDATTRAAKRNCKTGTLAKSKCKEANGGKDCSDVDLIKGVKNQVTKDLRGLMETCVSSKTTSTDKENCRKSKTKDFKNKIAEAEGKDLSELRDSDVMEFIKKGARNAIMDTVSLCNSTDAKDRQRCAMEGKKAMAETLGKSVDQVKEFEFKRFAKKGKASKVAEAMKACMELAGSDATKRKDCAENEAKRVMKENSLDGAEPNKAKVMEFLKEASKEAAKSTRKNCIEAGSAKAACDAEVKKAIAASLGKAENEVTEFETKEVERKAALESALDAARDCYLARKDNATATCENPVDRFKESAGKTNPSEAVKQKAMEMKVKLETLRSSAKESRKLCLEKATKTEVTTCLNEAKTEEDGVAGVLFSGSTTLDKKKQRAQREANVDVLGDVFGSCMKAATDDGSRTACKTAFEANKEKLGESEKSSNLLKRARANLLIEPAEACDATDLKKCRDAAKEEATRNGMPEREYGQVKRVAEIKGAAQEWTACSEGGATDDKCHELAKEKFVEISGAKAEDYLKKPTPDAKQTVKERVGKLGKDLKDGKKTKLVEKKKVSVTSETSGNACDDTVKAGVKSAIDEMKGDTGATPELKKLKGSTSPTCRVVDGKSQYTTVVDAKDLSQTEIDTVSDKFAVDLASKKYKNSKRRRLLAEESTTNSYAAQEVTECAEGDADCENDDEIQEESVAGLVADTSSAHMASVSLSTIVLGLFSMLL